MKYCNMQIPESILCHHVDVFAGKNNQTKIFRVICNINFQDKSSLITEQLFIKETLAVFSETFFNQTEK